MRNLLAGGAEVDRRDFLARADLLAACGMTVLISDYFEYYRLAAYLARRTKERIGIVLGAASLIELFDEKYYTQLHGGILESFGRLFKNDLKLYVYPLRERQTGELTTVENLQVAPELRKLYGYLADRGSFVHLDNFNPEYLRSSRATCSSTSPPETRHGRKWSRPACRPGDETAFLRLQGCAKVVENFSPVPLWIGEQDRRRSLSRKGSQPVARVGER